MERVANEDDRQVALVLSRAPVPHSHVRGAREPGELLQQRRLSDARLPEHVDGPIGVPRRKSAQRFREHGEFGLTADEVHTQSQRRLAQSHSRTPQEDTGGTNALNGRRQFAASPRSNAQTTTAKETLMHMIRRRPRPSTIIATPALVLATSDTEFAAAAGDPFKLGQDNRSVNTAHDPRGDGHRPGRPWRAQRHQGVGRGRPRHEDRERGRGRRAAGSADPDAARARRHEGQQRRWKGQRTPATSSTACRGRLRPSLGSTATPPAKSRARAAA